MKVHWTRTAVNHLEAIYEYIGKDSPSYAKRTIDRLTKRSEAVAAFPYVGRAVPEYQATDIREVIEKPYRIIYRIKRD